MKRIEAGRAAGGLGVLLSLVLISNCSACSNDCADAAAALDAGPPATPIDCANSWSTVAQPFFTRYCSQCHDWQDAAAFAPSDGESASQVGATALACGMPPMGEAQPSEDDLRELLGWMSCGACTNANPTCTTDSDCTNGTCSCGACCLPPQSACAPPGTDGGGAGCCPSASCSPVTRLCCINFGEACAHNADCCSGICAGSQCDCLPPGAACSSDAECCGGCRLLGPDAGVCN